MTISFKYDETDLSSLGVVTKIDDVYDLAQQRGGNLTIPFRHGTIFARKYYDERKITIGIAVVSNSGTAQDTAMDTIKALFSSGTQKTLELTMNDSSKRTALATVDDPLDITWIHDTFLRLIVVFTLTEPFFRSDTLIADNTTTIDSDPKAMTVTNTGTMQERDPVITLTGPLADFGMTNSENGLELNYAPVIDGGDTVTIETVNGEYLATHSVLGNVTGFVTHAGDSCLMAFEPGDNVLSITSSTATTGTVKVSFYPPFI